MEHFFVNKPLNIIEHCIHFHSLLWLYLSWIGAGNEHSCLCNLCDLSPAQVQKTRGHATAFPFIYVLFILDFWLKDDTLDVFGCTQQKGPFSSDIIMCSPTMEQMKVVRMSRLQTNAAPLHSGHRSVTSGGGIYETAVHWLKVFMQSNKWRRRKMSRVTRHTVHVWWHLLEISYQTLGLKCKYYLW